MILDSSSLVAGSALWHGGVVALAAVAAKIYMAYQFRALRSARDAEGRLTVRGTVYWALSRKRLGNVAEVKRHLGNWEKRGYKIALLIRKGQRVERLAYAAEGGGDLELKPDAKVAASAHKALGTPSGSRWVGFVSAGGRRKSTLVDPNVVAFDVSLTVARTARTAQIMPVISRHLEGSFADSYMPGLWVLPAARRR
jgi:hypothetical protein